jgi:hypothetical protein
MISASGGLLVICCLSFPGDGFMYTFMADLKKQALGIFAPFYSDMAAF